MSHIHNPTLVPSIVAPRSEAVLQEPPARERPAGSADRGREPCGDAAGRERPDRSIRARQCSLLDRARRSLWCAEQLLAAGSPDFAVSRAYFAMYYAATALLLERGLVFHKHGALILALSREFGRNDLVPRTFCAWLIEANAARLAADYGDAGTLSPQEAATHLERAGGFVALLESILGLKAGGRA